MRQWIDTINVSAESEPGAILGHRQRVWLATAYTKGGGIVGSSGDRLTAVAKVVEYILERPELYYLSIAVDIYTHN